jgi:formamidopyrimidine-DNA glycosylase
MPANDLRFVDQRMFGGVWDQRRWRGVAQRRSARSLLIHSTQPSIEDAVVARIRKSSSGIKRLLLNQNVVSGIGNIYADEALWSAQVHGERPGSSLDQVC